MTPDSYEITEQGPYEVATRFTIEGTDGHLRATMSDDHPPSSSGRARISLSYGDTDIEAYARNGETPHIQVSSDNWSDTVDGYSGEPITDDAIEDWNKAASILEEVTGQVAVHTGTEIFYKGQADWKEPRSSEERIKDGLDYPVSPSNTSHVETATRDPTDLEDIATAYEPDLEPLAESGALTEAWDRFIEGYEDKDVSPF